MAGIKVGKSALPLPLSLTPRPVAHSLPSLPLPSLPLPAYARDRPPAQLYSPSRLLISLTSPPSLPADEHSSLAQPLTQPSSASKKRPRPASVPLDPSLDSDSRSSSPQHRDRVKLSRVLDSIDPDHVLARQLPHSDQTLRDALTDSSISFLALRDLISQVVSPSSSAAGPALVDFATTALALLSDLAAKHAAAAETNSHAPGVKRDLPPDAAEPTAKRFMLHRGLGSLDLFTSIASLDDDDLALLAEAEDTDVIAVLPPPSSAPSPPIPRLSFVSPQTSLAPPTSNPQLPPTPVQFLYYDPFSSFAPTYSSSHSTLSYSSSVSFVSSRARLSHWSSTIHALQTPPPPLPPTRHQPLTATPAELTAELSRNSDRIAFLVRAQWERLRGNPEEEGGTTTTEVPQAPVAKPVVVNGKGKKSGASTPVPAPPPPPTPEALTATALLTSLSHLLTFTPPSTLVAPEAVRRGTEGILALEEREPSFFGNLDGENYRAVREERNEEGGLRLGDGEEGEGTRVKMEE